MDHSASTISSLDAKRIGSRSKHNVRRLIEIKLCVLNVVCSKVTLSVPPNHELFSLAYSQAPPPRRWLRLQNYTHPLDVELPGKLMTRYILHMHGFMYKSHKKLPENDLQPTGIVFTNLTAAHYIKE